MEIYKRLQQARDLIRATKIKKAGTNKFSGYDYFTPEQVASLVHEAEKETGLIHIFSLERDQIGTFGRLTILNIEIPDEMVCFTQATEIPEIKATNAAQQIGGAVTYTLRYMLMTAFNIADNSLDFDSQDNREEKPPPPPARHIGDTPAEKKPISDNAFSQLCDKLRANPEPKDRGNLLAKVRRYYLPFSQEQENIISQITDN